MSSKRASRKRRADRAKAAPGPLPIRAASGPSLIRLTADGGERVEWAADVAAADGKPAPKKFSMTAYTGGAMKVGFGWPVVVDLAGMSVPRQDIPALRQHDPERIVGHTDSVEVLATKVKVSGVVSGAGDAADEVKATAANGFPWQVSIGASVEKLEFVERGETAKANNRTFAGPVYIARQTTLAEVSFVPLGADGATSATVAAQSQGGSAMDFNAWVQAKGFDPAALSEQQRKFLLAQFEAEQKGERPAQNPAPQPPPPVSRLDAAADVENYRKTVVAEQLRVTEIARICGRYDRPKVWVGADGSLAYGGEAGAGVDLEAHAIAAGFDEKTTEVHALRADRARVAAPRHGGTGRPATVRADVLECAVLMARGLPGVEKAFKPETLEAAHKEHRNIGLQSLVMMAATANGYAATPGERIHNGNIREVLGHAFPRVKAAASTFSLSGILGNVANKELLAGYTEEDMTWREIAAVKSVSNFHAVTSYRMLDDMEYEEVGPDGKIKHGTVGQESYTRQAKTYAKMFALTRQDIINDDLGAFDDLRTRLGRGSAQKFNNLFWTNFLANHSTFFTTARTNYITGATTTLLTDGVGLGLALKAFRQMKSPSSVTANDSGKRIGGRPEILLVPPELEYAADQLFMGEKLTESTGNGPTNTYRNKYRPVVCPWLSDSAFTGYSATAWYLLRSPSIAPMMVVSFLNGMQTPTVESADADFDTLGVQFRGFHDFGCDQAEYLCGIKSKGAA